MVFLGPMRIFLKVGFMADNTKWRRANPERARELNRLSEKKRRLRIKFGMTLDDYNQLFEKQNNACAICLDSERGKRDWHLDHDHTTGKVRGILCHWCNLMLGHARDSEDILEAGMRYLQEHYNSQQHYNQ